MKIPRLVLCLTASAAILMGGALANAVPAVGSGRPDVTLQDGWDRTLELARYRGMPILVVYEDKDSATINQGLKEELSKLAKGDRYKRLIALVAVADVSGYDYWPVRGFVKDAIKSESHKQGTLIYCDWDGHVRGALGLHRGTSNVVLFGKDDKVLFSHAGALSSEQQRALIGLLREQVDGKPSAPQLR
jgi:hypothetical protein